MVLAWPGLALALAAAYFVTAASFEQRLYIKCELLAWIEHGLHLTPRFTVAFMQDGVRRIAWAQDVVRYLRGNGLWMTDYHALIWGSVLLGLLATAAVYGVIPDARDRPFGKRHLRGARVRASLVGRPAHRWFRLWASTGFVVSLIAWWRWAEISLPSDFPGGVLIWVPRAFELYPSGDWPAPVRITVAAALVGYAFGAAGIWIWPMIVEGVAPVARHLRLAPRRRLKVAGVPLPFELETRNILIVGRIGSGKTQVIEGLLRGIRARGARALIADPDGSYLSRFGKPGDRVLNPFDRRTVHWSPFAEVHSAFDYMMLAKAILPESESPNEEEWRSYGRTLLAATLKRLHEDGRTHPGDVLRTINQATNAELAILYTSTNAAGLTRHDAMFNSVMGVMTPRIATWEYLPAPDSRHPAFSIREWVRNREGRQGSWLYLTYRDDQREALQYLIATWLSLATTEGLSLPEDLSHRFYCTIDELDSLGPIAALKHALTKLRKHGGVVIAGLQTSAQPRVSYGRDGAQILLSSFGNKVILSLGDHETAQHFEEELGRHEIERVRTSRGVGTSGSRGTTSSSVARESAFEPVILASELMGLKDRHGFFRRAGTSEILPITVPLIKMPILVQPFVER
jgi:hypothetical protein